MKKLFLLLAALAVCASARAQSYGLYQTCQLQTATGQAVPGAQVYFLTQPANTSTLTPQAQVYSSTTGGAVNQPLTTNGFGYCVNSAGTGPYLAPGLYTVCYVSQYTGTQCFPDQAVYLPQGGSGILINPITQINWPIASGSTLPTSLCPTSTTGNLISGSPTVIVASTANVYIGQTVTGTGIPSGALVGSINSSASTVTLTANATATQNNVTLSFASIGQPFQDTANNTEYFCTAAGWSVPGVASAEGTSPVLVNGESGAPQTGALTVSCPTCAIGSIAPGTEYQMAIYTGTDSLGPDTLLTDTPNPSGSSPALWGLGYAGTAGQDFQFSSASPPGGTSNVSDFLVTLAQAAGGSGVQGYSAAAFMLGGCTWGGSTGSYQIDNSTGDFLVCTGGSANSGNGNLYALLGANTSGSAASLPAYTNSAVFQMLGKEGGEGNFIVQSDNTASPYDSSIDNSAEFLLGENSSATDGAWNQMNFTVVAKNTNSGTDVGGHNNATISLSATEDDETGTSSGLYGGDIDLSATSNLSTTAPTNTNYGAILLEASGPIGLESAQLTGSSTQCLHAVYVGSGDPWLLEGTGSDCGSGGSFTLTTTGTSGEATYSGGTLNIPVYQGALTLTTTGSSGPATLSGNTLNIPEYGGGSSGISGLTAGYIPLAGSATTITADSHIDDGVTTASTLTATEPMVGPSYTANGSANGALNLTSIGTAATAPGADTIQITAPNSVTAYAMELPDQAPSGSGTYLSCTAANPSVCSWGSGAAAGSGLFAGLLSIPTLSSAGLTTAYNQAGTFTASNVSTGISLADTVWHSGTYWEGVLGTYPDEDFTLTAMFSTPTNGQNYQAIGFCVAASTTGAMLSVGGIWNSGPVWENEADTWTSPTAHNTALLSRTSQTAGPFIWYRFQDNGTDLIFSSSSDGVNFYPWLSLTRSTYTSYLTYIGPCMEAGDTSGSEPIGTVIQSWTETTP